MTILGISLKNVHAQLEEIANTPSTNDKKDLLRKYLKSPLFKKVIWCAYNQTLKFNVKSFPKFNPTGFNERGFEHVYPILQELSKRNGADNVIKQRLFQAASIDKPTYDIVSRICDADLRCGIGARLINQAVPNTIKIYSYQRCSTSKYISNIRYSPYAISQCKADGEFVNVIISKGRDITFLTRNGKEIFQLEHLKKKIMSQKPLLQFGHRRGIKHSDLGDFFNKNIMGELRVYYPNGSVMPRKIGNGEIRKCQTKTQTANIAKRIFLTVWDCVPLPDYYNGECEEFYSGRFYNTSCFVNVINDHKWIRLVPFENVTSIEETYAFFRKMRALGEEGTVTSNVDSIWEDDQSGSHDRVKMKHSFECELRVVGWNYGTKGKKYEKVMGSVDCESECGKLKVNVSGFTDEERQWDWDMMEGEIITVEAESVITSKSKTTVSLYTPSFVEVRENKTRADTLEEIIEIAESSKKTRRVKA